MNTVCHILCFCSSLSGVVNIYDSSCLTERRPKPLKSVMNLTSACTTLKFNPASEMLCALSSHSEQAVKMVKKHQCVCITMVISCSIQGRLL